MQIRLAARIFGIIYIIVGIVGFIPGISPPVPADYPHLALGQFYNNELGVFTVNWLHSIVHIVIGIWALGAAGSVMAGKSFFRANGWIFVVLFILGIIPATNTVFGLVPLFGWDAGLHLITAIVAFYFGYSAAATENTVTV
ncbi:MAG TPA: DUF4383 domain-containing protein [Candidatus Baltobacteraceae bacterium]|jgi:hypothetical protein